YGRRFENGLDLLLSGSWYDSQGPENLFFKEFNQPTNNINNGIAHKADDDAYQSVFGSIGLFDFTLEGAYHNREKGIPTTLFGTKFNDRRTRSTDERSFVSLKFAHEFPESVDLS